MIHSELLYLKTTNILTIKFPTLLVYTWFICATLITYLGQAELEIEL